MRRTTSPKEKEEHVIHDELVMLAVEHIDSIIDVAAANGWVEDAHRVYATVEHCLTWRGLQMRADVAFWRAGSDRPFLLLEIKSYREKQSASSWTTQTRNYEEGTDTPCVLIVAHDLSESMAKYLSFAKVKTIDLRRVF